MNINPRPPGNLALGVGAATLLGLRWLPPQFSDPALSAGIILSAAGLMLRLVATDSRAKQGRGGILDTFLCGLIVLPIVWFLVSGLLLLFRSGMACQSKAPVDEQA